MKSEMKSTTDTYKRDVCPWCRNEGELVVMEISYMKHYAVKCPNKRCPVRPFAGYYPTEKKAEEAWKWSE